ncbi:MAG: ABC transporter substrate-binding protein [Defluviitaleaceae bacterium]|nr:ABC transporter substrate-binding protein [Defluviitaleaceae bacterium]
MHRTISVKRAFALVIAGLLALSFAACGGGQPVGPAGAPRIVYYATNSEPILDWDPSVEFSNGIIVMHNIYETLLKYLPETDSFEYVLATGYEQSADGMSWTFDIRQGVKFHDGTYLDAEAVKFSFDRTIEMDQGAAFIFDAVDYIEVIDTHRVRINLVYEAPMDLIVAAGYAAFIMSPTAVRNNPPDWLSQGNVAGTGPYIVRSHIHGEEVVLERFEDYWRGWDGNHTEIALIRKIPETASRRQLLESGEASFITFVTPEDHAALRQREGITVEEYNSFQNLIFFFNNQKEPLNNPLVRQALSYAFPYSDVIDHVMQGEATQSRGIIPKGLWGHGSDILQYNYDLERAGALLAEAGYPDGGFTLSATFTAGDEAQRRSLELFQSELDKLGITLDIRGMPWDSQWDAARVDPTQAQDIFVMYWWIDFASPISWLFNLFYSEDDTLFNLSYYSDPEVDDLIDEGSRLSGFDRAAAARVFIEAQQIIMQDAAVIPVYDQIYARPFRDNLRGYRDNPAYPSVVFFYDVYLD